jgi:hypothetical protein
LIEPIKTPTVLTKVVNEDITPLATFENIAESDIQILSEHADPASRAAALVP